MTAGRDFDQSDEEEFMFEVKNSTICKSLFWFQSNASWALSKRGIKVKIVATASLSF